MVILFLAAVLLWFSQFLFLPLLPVMLLDRLGSLTVVGMILSMYGLAQLLFRIPASIAADSTGAGKVIMAGGFLLTGIGVLLLLFSRSVPVLMAARLLTGLGASVWVLLIASFTTLFPAHAIVAATALVTIANGLGKTCSTLLTGFLTELGGDLLVYSVSAGAAFAAAGLILAVRIEHPGSERITLSDLGRMLTLKSLVIPTIGHSLAMLAAWAVPLSFLPVRARELGAGSVETGLLLSLHLAAFTASNIINARTGSRISIRKLTIASVVVFSAGNALAAAAAGFSLLIVSGMLSGIGFGFLQSCYMGTSMRGVPAAKRATALGIHQSVYAVGVFAGPWLGGLLAERFGLPTMFAIVTLSSLAVLLPAALLTED